MRYTRAFYRTGDYDSLEVFNGTRVLVLGDVMLDRYWYGTVNRISPEAPVPVVLKERCTATAGGAGNVACNLAALGATPLLLGVVGNDESGTELRRILVNNDVPPDCVLIGDGRRTTVKLRVVTNNQHILRIDEEESIPVSECLSRMLFHHFSRLVDSVDVILLSDYEKGVLTRTLLRNVMQAASVRRLKVIVDPKGSDYSRYNGAYLLSPNSNEALTAARVSPDVPDAITKAGLALLDDVDVKVVLITQGEKGITIFERGSAPNTVAAEARSVCDVTGAGDTVVAVIALGIANGWELGQAVAIANAAAGLAITQFGTTIVTLGQLRQFLDQRKRAYEPQVSSRVASWSYQ